VGSLWAQPGKGNGQLVSRTEATQVDMNCTMALASLFPVAREDYGNCDCKQFDFLANILLASFYTSFDSMNNMSAKTKTFYGPYK